MQVLALCSVPAIAAMARGFCLKIVVRRILFVSSKVAEFAINLLCNIARFDVK